MNKCCTISSFQLFSITCFSMLFGLNFYPSAINHSITRQWLIAQIITILTLIPLTWMILQIADNTEELSFENILKKLFGKVFSRIIAFILFIYFIIQSYKLLFFESNKVQLFLFDKTPVYIIAAVILLVSFIITLKDFSSAAKLTELLVIPCAAVIFISLLIYFRSADTNEFKTLFTSDTNGLSSQIIRSVSCFSGFEIILFNVCKTRNNKTRKKAVFSGFALCSVIIILFTLCITGVFTIKTAAGMHYPFTELARSVQLNHLRIVERFDAVTIPINISAVCIYISLLLFASSEALSAILSPLKFRFPIAVYICIFIPVIFLFQENIVNLISKYIIFIELFILLIIIPLMYFLSIKEKKYAH